MFSESKLVEGVLYTSYVFQDVNATGVCLGAMRTMSNLYNTLDVVKLMHIIHGQKLQKKLLLPRK